MAALNLKIISNDQALLQNRLAESDEK